LRELAVLDRAEVFHVVNSGTGASYEEFARFAVKTAGLDEETVEPVSVTSLCRPARRPANSCLRCLISESLNLVPMPDWQTAVRKFVTHETLPIDTRAVAPARP
jgi:dTDP-4-dehydrorhamnose reductase